MAKIIYTIKGMKADETPAWLATWLDCVDGLAVVHVCTIDRFATLQLFRDGALVGEMKIKLPIYD